ncbi:hypothetical protein Cme02nite_33460 [Catellatospora methionotrophica]|uniref:Peptidase inhibitor family I36 n=1 Tax=Catellatospora methionotrophica TaxID=121620 RepID=A0A8J3LAX8_9ACTN|nr:hypothetical protein [Catellatospora methionotrophica]GIG15014.1 hypothetical protein Cme02nite_33460 [Catellatospora methionotrophica]
MRLLHKGLLATGAMVAALLASPVAAQATGTPVCPSSDGTGCLYAWTWYNNEGYQCSWFNSDGNWGDDCPEGLSGGFRNQASSLENQSSHGNYARLYFHPSYTGAWACVGPGEYWNDLSVKRFNRGSGRDGYNYVIDNEIAGFKWSTSCG